MGLTNLLQSQIEAQQLLDDVDYALRSIKVSGSAMSCTGVHGAQLVRGCVAASEVLDCTYETILYSQGGHGAKDRLVEVKAVLREVVAETKAAVKAAGTAAQRRLLLVTEAESHEYALAA